MLYAELFAGAGGMSRGLEEGGFAPFAHAEIEPHARAVLRRHWPGCRLDGDVTKVNGADYRGITLLSGGSPCQDLSVAGKRAGLGGARSGLFHEQVRIWRESGAPYLLWENVYGALSSNAGEDFATVLGTIVGANVAVPLVRGKPKWQRAGVATGPAAVAAWRVLDLQHFGPPQRRVRVFVLAARTGGVDPAEVLALGEGVCGHPAPRREAGEGAARGAQGGAGAKGLAVNISKGEPRINEVLNTLQARSKAGGIGSGQQIQAVLQPEVMARGKSGADRNGVLAFQNTGQGWWNESDTAQTLRTPSGGDATFANVVCTTGNVTHALTTQPGATDDGTGRGTPIVVVPTLQGANNGSTQVPAVLAFQNTGQGWWNESDTAQTLRTPSGGDATFANVVCTTGHVTHALTHEGADASEDGTGRGTPIVVASGQANAEIVRDGSPSLTCLHEAPIVQVAANRPRRLTPRECERLMGWPDDWTAVGVDEAGREYRLSDTARYRLCGNGVGSPCAAWIAKRLAYAIRGAP